MTNLYQRHRSIELSQGDEFFSLKLSSFSLYVAEIINNVSKSFPRFHKRKLTHTFAYFPQKKEK
jgi:hypothetical protein